MVIFFYKLQNQFKLDFTFISIKLLLYIIIIFYKPLQNRKYHNYLNIVYKALVSHLDLVPLSKARFYNIIVEKIARIEKKTDIRSNK